MPDLCYCQKIVSSFTSLITIGFTANNNQTYTKGLDLEAGSIPSMLWLIPQTWDIFLPCWYASRMEQGYLDSEQFMISIKIGPANISCSNKQRHS